jgi:hypothetical protein
MNIERIVLSAHWRVMVKRPDWEVQIVFAIEQGVWEGVWGITFFFITLVLVIRCSIVTDQLKFNATLTLSGILCLIHISSQRLDGFMSFCLIAAPPRGVTRRFFVKGGPIRHTLRKAADS